MAERYWIGDEGDWAQIAHWSASSGGLGGETVPSSSDNVHFDGNSFSIAGQTVVVNASSYCLNMNWTGATNAPRLYLNASIYVYGDITFISTLNYAHNDHILYLNATDAGNTLTTNGISMGNLTQQGVGGEYTLQDNVTGTSLHIVAGTFNTNDKDITCSGLFSFGEANVSTINLGTSTITCSTLFCNSVTNLTFNSGTSTIITTGNTVTFGGNGLTYNNVEFQGTPTTITGSNTFDDLKFTVGKTINLTAGTTQTVTTLTSNGTYGNLITIQSTSAGSAATISKSSGTVIVLYCSIQDITANGGATFNAVLSTDVSGNTGWQFDDTLTDFVRVFGKSTIDKLHIKNVEVSDTDIQNIDITTTLVWDIDDTLLLAEFEGNLDAGNVTDITEAITNWQVTRTEQGSSVLEILDTVPVATIQYIDYTVAQDITYIYYIFGLTTNQISSALETAPVLTNFYGFFLVDPDNAIVYKFDMNVTSGSNDYQEDVTLYNNYTQYPAFAIGQRKYMTTTIQALPGTISVSGLSQSVDFIYDLRDFVLNGTEKLWKTRKGEIFNVKTKNFKYIPLSDGIEEQPMVISFDIIETSAL